MGGAVSSEVWSDYVRAHQDRCATIVLDRRGTGRSDKPAEEYTTLGWAEDAVRVLDALGLPSVHMIGWSLGGAVAQHVAIHHPARVRSLVLHASFARMGVGIGKRRLQLQLELLAQGDAKHFADLSNMTIFSPRFLARRPDVVARFESLRGVDSPSPEAMWRVFHTASTHDTLPLLRSIGVPTLVTVGDLDLVTPLEQSEELAREIPGARLHVFAGAGQMLFLEVPEAVRDVSLAFLAHVTEQERASAAAASQWRSETRLV